MRVLIVLFATALVAVGAGATAHARSAQPPLLLHYPKATAVPTGSRYLKATVSSWRSDASALSSSPSTMYVGNAVGLQRIDPAKNAFETPFVPLDNAANTAYANGLVWAGDYDSDVVRAIDETTGAVKKTVQLPVGSGPVGVVAADGAIWVAEHHGGVVARIDEATGKVVAQVKAGFAGPSGPEGLAYGAGSLWVSVPNSAQVVRINPTTNRVVAIIRVPIMTPCGGIAVGTTSVWVTNCLDAPYVARISIKTNKVVRVIDMQALSVTPVAQGDTAWFLVGRDPDVPSRDHGYLVQLSNTDKVLRRYDLGPRFTAGGTAIAFGSVWATSWTTPWVARVPLP